MVMEAKISSSADGHLHLENIPIQDSDSGIMSSAPDHVEPRQPEKRPTRQWAAWTRQEEESFFTALRHVGKNFEKITRRVQSKNKDQVRHYYYRLVRRMNKLLGPGLCLDAKNSKDTNAAMLRWWSLLEKYSCKASKLHLKPRRFKIFMDALENQLLKDRKKNVRKRSSQADNVSPTASSTTTNQNRALGHETRTVKLVLVESQNMQKIGAGRGSLKRNVCVGVIRGNNKGDSTANKPARQRRKQAAYKKWEKAAIAGVSLVADAAEHLERTTTDKEVEHDQVQTDLDPVDKVLAPVPASSLHCTESNVHNNTKLKLQLFPIDDSTRRALEVDKHNPHLELTLSTRKKISSVLEHLNRKWGNSSIACGELVLFPYVVQRENLASYQRWTQDSIISAADVYNLTGSPPVFRLRYGWFPNLEFASATFQVAATSNCIPLGIPVNAENVNEEIQDSVSTYRLSTNDQCEKLVDLCADHLKNDPPVSPLRDASNAMSGFVALASKSSPVKPTDPAANISWHRKENTTNAKQLEDTNVTTLSTREWADSLTNISIGDLLSGVPHEANPNCIEPPFPQNTQCLDQLPFSCDSFDAAIAAHVSRHHNKMNFSSALTSSIWDAEETCDAFSFQRGHAFCHELPTSSHAASPTAGKQTIRRSPMASGAFLEDLPEVEEPVDYPACGDPMDICPSEPQLVDNSPKDFNGLADIYWPESLGPLDLDIASSKYHNEDFILSDSLGGLSNLIASSLDAFQSCSFFALNKKDSTSKVEAPGSASFADFKIGSGRGV